MNRNEKVERSISKIVGKACFPQVERAVTIIIYIVLSPAVLLIDELIMAYERRRFLIGRGLLSTNVNTVMPSDGENKYWKVSG